MLPFDSEQCKIDREKLRVKVEVNDVVRNMQIELKLALSRAHLCPGSRQPNFKVNVWWLPYTPSVPQYMTFL